MKELRTKIVLPDYNTQLDLYEDVALALTFSIAEIRDISLRRSNYSKTFTLPGSESNNRLFNGIFNINTFDWSYDLNVKTKAFIYSDDNLIFEGYLKLEKIIKNNENINYDLEIQYEVVFYDSVGSFYETIKGKTLEDLDLSQYNHKFSLSNISKAMNYDWKDGYTYPLLRKKYNDYWTIDDFQPAYYVRTILDRIFLDAGYAYESTFLTSDFFNKLIILNNEKIVNQPDDVNNQKIKINDTNPITLTEDSIIKKYFGGDTVIYLPSTMPGMTYNGYQKGEQITFVSEVLDPGNKWDISTSQYTGSGSKVEVTVDVQMTTTINNNTGFKLILYAGSTPQNNHYRYNFYLCEVQNSSINMGGGGFFNMPAVTSNRKIIGQETKYFTSKLPYLYGAGSTITLTDDFTVIFPEIEMSEDKKYEIYVTAEFQYNKWYIDPGLPFTTPTIPQQFFKDPIITPTVGIRSISTQVSEVAGEGNTFYGDAFINNKLKQSDFILSLCKMFNLYIDKSKDRDNTFIIKPRNDYYSTYNTVDWTDKIDTTTQELTFLSDVQNKTIKFQYQTLNTDFGKEYNDITNDNFGSFEVEFENEYLTDEQIIANTFTIPSSVYSDINYGVYIPDIAVQEPSNSFYIMYATPATATSTGNFSIRVSGATNEITLSRYVQALHTNDVDEPDFTLCYSWPEFDQIKYDYKSDNGLYNKYWYSYIQQIANGKLLTAYFDLNGTDIYNIGFNDRIWVKDSYYVLNSIVDYSPNINSLTKVELIQINEGFDWIEQPKKYIYTGSTDYTRTLMDRLRTQRSSISSLNTLVVGRRNITPPNSIVSGDLNRLKVERTAFVLGDNNTFNRTDFTTSNYGRPPLASPPPAVVIGSNNYVNNKNTMMVLGDGNYISEDQDVVAKIGNMVITSTGFYFDFNLVDPGADIVINPFRRFAENLIDSGADCVKGLSGNSQIDLVRSGQDSIIGNGYTTA